MGPEFLAVRWRDAATALQPPCRGSLVASPGAQVNLQLHEVRQLDQQLGANLWSDVGQCVINESPDAGGGLWFGGVAEHVGSYRGSPVPVTGT